MENGEDAIVEDERPDHDNESDWGWCPRCGERVREVDDGNGSGWCTKHALVQLVWAEP